MVFLSNGLTFHFFVFFIPQNVTCTTQKHNYTKSWKTFANVQKLPETTKFKYVIIVHFHQFVLLLQYSLGITNISILRTDTPYKTLINPFYVTNSPYSELFLIPLEGSLYRESSVFSLSSNVGLFNWL